MNLMNNLNDKTTTIKRIAHYSINSRLLHYFLLTYILLCSTILSSSYFKIHLDKNWFLSGMVGVAPVYILFSLIFFRLFIKKMKFEKHEYLFGVYILFSMLSVFLNAANMTEVWNAIKLPLVVGITFIGISSYVKLTETSVYLDFLLYFVMFIAFFLSVKSYMSGIQIILIQYNNGGGNVINILQNPLNWLGFYNNPNRLSITLLPGILSASILIYRSWKNDNFKRWILYLMYFISFLLFVNMILLQCRGTISVYLIFLTWIVILYFKNGGSKNVKGRRYIKAGFTILGIVLVFFILNEYLHIIDSIINKTRTRGSTHRFDIWKSFLNYQFNRSGLFHILFGNSIVGKVIVYNPHLKDHLTHNFIFETWGRYGFFALIFLLSTIGTVLKRGLKNRNLWHLAAAVTAILLHNLVEDYIFFNYLPVEAVFFAFLFFITAGGDNNNKNITLE